MKAIMYKSIPVESTTLETYRQILERSIKANKEHNITGYLYVNKEKILQVIEGNDKNVEQLFENIQKDQRHCNITTVFERKINYRLMQDWSMAIVGYDSSYKNKFNELSLVSKLYESADVKLIETFKQEVLTQ